MSVDSVPDPGEFDSRSRFRLRTLLHAIPFALLVSVFTYHHVVIGPGMDLFGNYEPSRLEWLFAATLVFLGQFVVLPLARNRALTRRRWNRYKQSRFGVAALAWTLLFVGAALFAPLVMQYPELHFTAILQPPVGFSVDADAVPTCVGEVANGRCYGSWTYPLGTQQSGRGILVYLVYGARHALEVGLTAAMLVVVIGTTVGVVAASVGGWTNEILMRYVDVQQSIPAIFVYLAVIAVFDLNRIYLVLVFGLFSWGGVARIVRSEAIQVAAEDFMQATNSAGASRLYTLRKHILPNVSGAVLTTVSVQIPFFIIAEASIAYLNRGDTAVTSWGVLIERGLASGVPAIWWWVATIPVIVLALTVASINIVGDQLQHALDPRDT